MKKTFSYYFGACLLAGALIFSNACKHSAESSQYSHEINMANFDTTVKPQQNFYEYVNGNWLKNHPIPAAEPSWGSFNVLQNKITMQLKTIIQAAAADKNAATGSIEQKVGDVYACAMDSVMLDKEGIAPLQDEFKRINAISDNKSLWNEAAHLMVVGPNVMFGFGVGQDPKISIKEACMVGQAGLTLPSKEYYTENNPFMKMLRGKYVDYATTMFEQMGETPATASKDAKTVLKIETQMADSSMDQVQERNIQAQYNKMTMAQLAGMTPNIDWSTCFNVFGIHNIDTVIVDQPVFIRGLSDMIKSVPLKDWKTYLRFHLLSREADKLSDSLAMLKFNFWGKTFYGLKVRKPRWKRAVEYTSGALGQLVGQLYVKKYFSPAVKTRVHEMVENIISAYKERIKNVTWMAPETKQYALAKLNKLMLKLCYPNKWKDYSALQLKRDSWLANSYRINEFEFHYDMNKYGKPVDRTEWGISPQTVNAYYDASMNEIVLTTGIMQPPFFDSTRDDAMNYGGIGAVIGHELTHGYDDQGSQFDAEGNLHKWWTHEDSTRFHQKLQVLINQFDNYVIDSMHVRGKLTIGENTADFGGITIAYQALQNDLKQHPEGKVDGFTPDQRFFISWAQVWRENIRPSFQKQLITTNPHSPNIFRANGPPSNTPAFYKAFDVKPGDAMYRPASQRAAIW